MSKHSQLEAHTVILQREDGCRVEVIWSGAKLDRPSVDGFLIRASKRALAQRLKRAIDAQAVYAHPVVCQEVLGYSYVEATCLVLGKRLHADLARLGF